jgi:hypothetical protein
LGEVEHGPCRIKDTWVLGSSSPNLAAIWSNQNLNFDQPAAAGRLLPAASFDVKEKGEIGKIKALDFQNPQGS